MVLNKLTVNGQITFVEAWSPKQSGICPLQEEADIPSMHFVANGRRLYRPEVVAGQLYKSGLDPVTAWTTAGALINRDDGLVDPSAYLTEPTGIMGAANFVATGIMGFADYRDYYLAETLRMAGIEGEQGVVWQKLENLNPASNNEALRDVRYALTQLEQSEEEQNIVPGVLPKPEVLVAGLDIDPSNYKADRELLVALRGFTNQMLDVLDSRSLSESAVRQQMVAALRSIDLLLKTRLLTVQEGGNLRAIMSEVDDIICILASISNKMSREGFIGANKQVAFWIEHIRSSTGRAVEILEVREELGMQHREIIRATQAEAKVLRAELASTHVRYRWLLLSVFAAGAASAMLLDRLLGDE